MVSVAADDLRAVLTQGCMQDGRTALMAACLSGSSEVVKLLLDRGADYKKGEREGRELALGQ